MKKAHCLWGPRQVEETRGVSHAKGYPLESLVFVVTEKQLWPLGGGCIFHTREGFLEESLFVHLSFCSCFFSGISLSLCLSEHSWGLFLFLFFLPVSLHVFPYGFVCNFFHYVRNCLSELPVCLPVCLHVVFHYIVVKNSTEKKKRENKKTKTAEEKYSR